MRNNLKVLILISITVIFSCVDRFRVPKNFETESSGEFLAGDTTYLEIKPVWDQTYGFSKPTEISIAQDGRIFVADAGNQSILVFNQDGSQPGGFNFLINLEDSYGNPVSPIDVDIDKKMNIFFIDGSQRVFVWNQYWAEVGINKISVSATFRHTTTGIDTIVNAGTDTWLSLLNDNNWAIIDGDMTNDQALIDSLIRPHIFYDGRYEVNAYLDTYYESDSSQFTGLTAPPDDENVIFVSDSYGGQNNQYRIIQINFERSLILELNSGDLVWAYAGRFGGTVKGYGTGAGTVNQPLSLDVDYQGNIYYTQAGNYFHAHMISPNLSGDFAVYTSGFQPEADEIMDPDIFSNAVDIAVDNNRNSYIVDRINADVTVFDSHGSFFKKAGYKDGLVKIMNEPVAAAVDQRGILYVCDINESAIYRFKLSNTLNEDLEQED